MMKLDKYNKFLKEAIRDDEYSYLNDDLSDNWDDSTQDDNYVNEGEDISDLVNLFNKLFDNSGIYDVNIEGTITDLNIDFNLNHRENLRYIVSIFEVLSKIKRDILPQFESQTDLWIDRSGYPLLSVVFRYDPI